MVDLIFPMVLMFLAGMSAGSLIEHERNRASK